MSRTCMNILPYVSYVYEQAGTEPGGVPRVPGTPMDFFDVMLILRKNIDFSQINLK